MKYIIILIILLLSFPDVCYTQVNNNDHFSVEWMGEIKSEKNVKEEGGFFSKLLDFFSGENEKKLLKPFNVIETDKDSYVVLDQGLLHPVYISSDGFKLIENEIFSTFPSLVGVCKYKGNKILFTDSKLCKVFLYDYSEDQLDTFKLSNKLEQPTGIVYDEINNLLYITDTRLHKIFVYNGKGILLRTIGKRGTEKENFNFPTFLALDKKNNLYVVDALNFKVKIFSDSGRYLNSFGQTGDATGFFNRPKGIAVDSFGHIFVVDALFHIVQVFDMEGNYLYNFGGLGQQKSRFWLPVGIFIDSNNNIFIADSYNSRIQKYRLIDGKN